MAAQGDLPNDDARRIIRQTLGEAGRARGSARYYAKRKIKATSSNNAKQKKRGRPATGVTPMMGVRISEELRGRIESWARSRPDGPSLSETISGGIRSVVAFMSIALIAVLPIFGQ